jgi:hypothetical protein
MRSIVFAATLVALAPVAMAQTSPYSSGGPAPQGPNSTQGPSYSTHGPGYSTQGPNYSTQGPSYSTNDRSRSAMAQPDPQNCGTPDEPKACPPMPRRPLSYYPANRE